MDTAARLKKARKSDLPKIMVRLPNDVKDWLEAQAAYHQSNQASEIVRALRERMERVEQRQQHAA